MVQPSKKQRCHSYSRGTKVGSSTLDYFTLANFLSISQEIFLCFLLYPKSLSCVSHCIPVLEPRILHTNTDRQFFLFFSACKCIIQRSPPPVPQI